jgi:hypothetical protein
MQLRSPAVVRAPVVVRQARSKQGLRVMASAGIAPTPNSNEVRSAELKGWSGGGQESWGWCHVAGKQVGGGACPGSPPRLVLRSAPFSKQQDWGGFLGLAGGLVMLIYCPGVACFPGGPLAPGLS